MEELIKEYFGDNMAFTSDGVIPKMSIRSSIKRFFVNIKMEIKKIYYNL